MRGHFLVAVLGLALGAAGCNTMSGAGLGALAGGLTGAGIGAIAGDRTAGALIGTGVGTALGAAIGYQNEREQWEYYVRHGCYPPPPVAYCPPPPPPRCGWVVEEHYEYRLPCPRPRVYRYRRYHWPDCH